MISEIITYINDQLSGMPFFETNYGLCELKSFTRGNDSKTVPVYYSSGKWNKIDLTGLGKTYIRKTSDVSISEVENYASCDIDYETVYPLRLFALTKRSELENNDAYSGDRLAQTLIKAISLKGTDLKRDIKARHLTITASLYSDDSQEILQDEFSGASKSDFKHWDLVVAVDINVTVIKSTICIDDLCDYVPSFCFELETKVAIP